ncbi:hypothetical protein [Streptomyces sp. NPDC096013]|uniref:hypothetical protein n=1 Tax=Streptomyces sp. NPDC096013 TaxID=3366069 RepID=UPI00381490C6
MTGLGRPAVAVQAVAGVDPGPRAGCTLIRLVRSAEGRVRVDGLHGTTAPGADAQHLCRTGQLDLSVSCSSPHPAMSVKALLAEPLKIHVPQPGRREEHPGELRELAGPKPGHARTLPA